MSNFLSKLPKKTTKVTDFEQKFNIFFINNDAIYSKQFALAILIHFIKYKISVDTLCKYRYILNVDCA